MANEQACPTSCVEVLDVENKWPYLPITPTYDQYVQRWVVMPEREGFHLKTRSVMKQLFEDVKWMVLQDKMKKRAVFKFRVDVWRREHNCPEDRAKRVSICSTYTVHSAINNFKTHHPSECPPQARLIAMLFSSPDLCA
jgi:hypothetical protein